MSQVNQKLQKGVFEYLMVFVSKIKLSIYFDFMEFYHVKQFMSISNLKSGFNILCKSDQTKSKHNKFI